MLRGSAAPARPISDYSCRTAGGTLLGSVFEVKAIGASMDYNCGGLIKFPLHL
jgi:hypothetical protein